MKIVVEMDVEDSILVEAKKHKELFDNLATQIVGDMRRRAFDALVDACEKASKEALDPEERGVIT